MKKQHHEILEYIFRYDEAGIREISSILERKHNDHRDYYGVSALLEASYIGFTGPISNDEITGRLNAYQQARVFQAYSQGEGNQTYDGVTVLSGKKCDSYFYIGPKGIEYFHARKEMRKGWYLVATLSLICSIISGVVVSILAR